MNAGRAFMKMEANKYMREPKGIHSTFVAKSLEIFVRAAGFRSRFEPNDAR